MSGRRRFLAAGGGLLLAGCAPLPPGAPASTATPTSTTPPTPADGGPPSTPPLPREVRGAWVATVDNIDWPSRRDLPTADQQAEAFALLDAAARLKLNAIVLQVRPACDALYDSTLEPWSEYFTGAQGRAPAPAWDPLAFWVREAHARGIELHAWFNPFRARHGTARAPLAASHIAKRLPDAVVAYGDLLWLDPGHPAAQRHSLDVMLDVVRRYDIDGLHIDDYFYPYPVEAPNYSRGGTAAKPGAPKTWLEFPDDASWAAYRLSGGALARADWRRDNVDRFVAALYREVRAAKPWVKIGISPFGVGRPDRRPEGIGGFSQYDQLYADVEKWLDEGWLDYLAPQLYWPIAQRAQSFELLHRYWLAQNRKGRAVWPGLFTSRIGAPKDPWAADEVLAQIALARRIEPAAGHIHFSMVALAQDRDGIATRLARTLYAEHALPPAMPWLDEPPPPAPQLVTGADGRNFVLPPGVPGVYRVAVWTRERDAWRFRVVPVNGSGPVALGDAGGDGAVQVGFVNRAGVMGALVRAA